MSRLLVAVQNSESLNCFSNISHFWAGTQFPPNLRLKFQFILEIQNTYRQAPLLSIEIDFFDVCPDCSPFGFDISFSRVWGARCQARALKQLGPVWTQFGFFKKPARQPQIQAKRFIVFDCSHCLVEVVNFQVLYLFTRFGFLVYY